MTDKSSTVTNQSTNTSITPDKSTIALHRDTKKSLAELGSKGKSYEDIIQSLLKEWRKTH